MGSWCLLVGTGGDTDKVEAVAVALTRSGALRRERTGAGLTLLASDAVTVRPLGDGILLGHLFTRSADPASDTASWPPDDDGTAFVRRHWGAYVAVRPAADGIELLRDPSGMAPCYMARSGSVWLVTDAPRLLFAYGLLTPSIDWRIVAASLVSHDWRGEQTALAGVEEVLPGTVVSVGPGGLVRRRVWDAWDFARPAPGQDLSAEALAETIDRCMAAWAGVYRRPLIEISGGLDSAVVAAALVRRAEAPQLITFAAGPGDPTELGYAQAIADDLGLPLEITHPQVEDVDLTRSHACDLPRPNARAFTQAADALSRAHAGAIGADAFASGGGGDDLFGYRQSIAPAIDRLWSEGPRFAVIRTLDDIARVSHATSWEAVTRFVRRIVARRQVGTDRSDTRLLAPEARGLAAVPHSAEACRNRSMPGKAAHVRAIATLSNHLEGHGRASFAPVLFPLLSQPIVEFCLAVPSWRWCEGGENRALARRAFADRLPTCVIERRSKGAFDGFCARLFDRNRGLVGELLLEGGLAGQGILDRAAVEAAIRNPAPSGELVMRLLALVDAEAWLRSWSEQPATGLPAPASGYIARASLTLDPRVR
ncbi:asparagine synthase-related protein [Sphingomonas sp.]|uniref:asparagine synthase-related protein n=1 Tax=Sphingomonas sp. TaxID=28214 RepID=UPI003F6EED58